MLAAGRVLAEQPHVPGGTAWCCRLVMVLVGKGARSLGPHCNIYVMFLSVSDWPGWLLNLILLSSSKQEIPNPIAKCLPPHQPPVSGPVMLQDLDESAPSLQVGLLLRVRGLPPPPGTLPQLS